MDQNTGKYIIIFGAIVLVAGILIYFFHDKMHWIGRLPGDIRIEKEHSRIYFPITTMIIFSILLTIIVNIIRKWF
jgi:hypothetical protein